MSRERQVVGLVVGGTAALLALLCTLTGVLEPVEDATIDLRFRLERAWAGRAGPDSSLLIVDYDDRTLGDEALRERYGSWPWPRSVHAAVLGFVDRGEPAAVAFDVRFDEADEAETDAAFAAALERSEVPVVLATFFTGPDADPAAEARRDAGRRGVLDALETHALSVRPSLEVAPRYYEARPPLRSFLEGADGVGVSNVTPDPDAVHRTVPLLSTWHGLAFPTLGLAAALGAQAADRLAGAGEEIRLDGERLPLDDGRLWLHWRDRFGEEPYPIVPVHRILETLQVQANGLRLDPARHLDPSLFAGRTVLIGATGEDAGDLLLASPFHPTEPGVHLQATLLDTVASKDFLRPLPAGWLVAVLLPLLGGMLFARLEATLARLAAIAGALVLVAGLTVVGFLSLGLIVPWVVPTVALAAAFVAALLPGTLVDELAALQGWIYRRLPASWRPEALPGEPALPRVFLSYRRKDSLAVTGRIHDKLVERFGKERVFMDFDAIPYGADFRAHLQKELARCEVFLVVMGPDWVGRLEEGGNRLRDDTHDFVRLEVEVALEQGIPMIPVLVGGAPMPDESEVPASLRPLLYRQAAVVDVGLDFHVHMERLLAAIRTLAGRRPATAVGPRTMEAAAGG